MELRQAIAKAKTYTAEVFSDENISEIGLEEVKYNENSKRWDITIGFNRQFQNGKIGQLLGQNRTYKVIKINDDTGEVVEIENRGLMQ